MSGACGSTLSRPSTLATRWACRGVGSQGQTWRSKGRGNPWTFQETMSNSIGSATHVGNREAQRRLEQRRARVVVVIDHGVKEIHQRLWRVRMKLGDALERQGDGPVI